MYDICLFAGTSEGRMLAEVLGGTSLKAVVCVATEYGETLVAESDSVAVRAGRMDSGQMAALFAQERFSLVIDATHPYAVNVTENIVAATRATGTDYLRLSRETDRLVSGAVYVNSVAEAAEYLKTKEGNVLVTTGSKELGPYRVIPEYQERLYVRVLPMSASLQACEEAGIRPAHIIAMQGPFDTDLNLALLRMSKARFLVTKDSGAKGGFAEKILAAREAGAVPVVIGRPVEDGNSMENERSVGGYVLEETQFSEEKGNPTEEAKLSRENRNSASAIRRGMAYGEVLGYLAKRYQVIFRQQVSFVGIGMGASSLLTGEAREALERADCIIGAKRAVEAAMAVRKKGNFFCSMDNEKIQEFIRAHPEYRNIAVVMTGDAGFYSGTKKLLPLLGEYEPKVYPGISSLQYFSAKLGLAWEDAHVLSLHGREGSASAAVAEHGKVFVLVGGEGGAKRVLEELCADGLGEVQVSVGERLSYPEEKISRGTAQELAGDSFNPLAVLFIQNGKAQSARCSACLPDEAFLRIVGESGNVPMTKAEIRAVSVAKLQLQSDSVVYDIGSGTGSVSIEMAAICGQGHVYAIECKREEAHLTERNKRHFGAFNLTVVEGMAPEACADLPMPTHAFIGGTKGKMYEIIDMLLRKNPQVRIVMNLIALESIAEAMRCLEALSFEEVEMVQVSVAKARKLGQYHMMNGQNPIMIVTCHNPKTGGSAFEPEEAPGKNPTSGKAIKP